MQVAEIINTYIHEVKRKYDTGIATEHAYRPALQQLIEGLCEGINAVNDAKRVEVGAPDFVLTEEKKDPRQQELIRSVPLGFVEAKDIKPGILDEPKNHAQLERYFDLGNVVHTDSLTFRFYFNRELVKEIVLAEVIDGQIIVDSRGYDDLAYYFKETVSRAGRTIRTAKLLALYMADRARPIRRTILKALNDDIENDTQTTLRDQYDAFKKVLIHDLEPKDFSDIYAETIAYGLFAARYNDDTRDDFSLVEAAQKIPQTNPFLRQFFLQIAAYEKDARLGWVLNNFADLFSYADVHTIMSTYGKDTGMQHDPVTHFYETFLGEYDQKRRKARGVYYTPLPVVQYIVRTVDKVLKDDFDLVDGLADDSTMPFTEHFGDERLILAKAEHKKRTWQSTREVQIPRVQVLDPATGTSTFLNEVVKLIAGRKAKNLGSAWSSYVEKNLLPRVHGFEILMAAYSMAHMRLGLTLTETGYKPSSNPPRLSVYLTNSLESPSDYKGSQLDIFSSMARAISDESHKADEVKRDLPIMVVIGNPPYSGVSSNETDYANKLITKYKVEPGGKQKLQERKHWLNDDYVKFLAYAESMIDKNGSGIVAMITNNGYLDNPTFRGMRWQLSKTFDKIYILDLHGNAKKMEVAPDGGKDENVFDIMQGVGVIVAVKTGVKQGELAELYHAEIYGKRQYKYEQLGTEIGFKKVKVTAPSHYFIPKNTAGLDEYQKGIRVDDLFIKNVSGIVTMGDKFIVDRDPDVIAERVQKLVRGEYTKDQLNNEFGLGKNYAEFVLKHAPTINFDPAKITRINYRQFDDGYTYFDNKLVWRWRENVMRNFIGHENTGLNICRQYKTGETYQHVFVGNAIVESSFISGRTSEICYTLPLWLYHEDGTCTPNIKADVIKKLALNLSAEPSPEETLDYVYAALHSPSYRAKYAELLKTDFPRVPLPVSDNEFRRFVKLGGKLRDLHLFNGVSAGDFPLEGNGDGEVVKLSYKDGKVFINNSQYFTGIPESTYNFFIGGYQPAQKWLKDHRGYPLGYRDIEHYQKIIKVLVETDRIMKEVG